MWYLKLLELYEVMTMQEMADKMGVHKSTISRLLKKQRKPGADIYEAIELAHRLTYTRPIKRARGKV